MKKSIQELATSVLSYISHGKGIPIAIQDIASENSDSSNRVEMLHKVHAEILQCTHCRLCEKRTHAVPGSGVCNARVFIVGEAPGAEEDTQGLPFVGRSGVYLDKWLQAISLQRDRDVFISNVVKCRPPGNRNPLHSEIQFCIPYLHKQIALVAPKTILALGRIASHALLNTQESIRVLRLSVHGHRGIPVLVSYHPSAVLRDSSLRRPVWEDLQKLRTLL